MERSSPLNSPIRAAKERARRRRIFEQQRLEVFLNAFGLDSFRSKLARLGIVNIPLLSTLTLSMIQKLTNGKLGPMRQFRRLVLVAKELIELRVRYARPFKECSS